MVYIVFFNYYIYKWVLSWIGYGNWGCIHWVLGLKAAGFELDLEAGGLLRYQVYHTDSAKPASDTDAAEPSAAKPNAGKATGLSMPFPTDATINQLD